MRVVPILQQPEIRSVAVFRALQLGDMLCAVPALRALRAALPEAAITLVGLAWAQQFADRFSRYIDEFVSFPGHAALAEQPAQPERLRAFYAGMKARCLSLALQMHGSGQVSNGIVQAFGAAQCAGYAANGTAVKAPAADAHFHALPYPHDGPEPLRLLDFVTALGASPMGSELEFPLTQGDWAELRASGLGDGAVPGRYVCIHPGARSRDKCWPPQRFAQIADCLARESGLSIVLTGSAAETDLTRAVAAHMRTPAIDAAGPISIGAMAALMSQARLLVCNDTGVSHIAAGLQLKSVVVFSKADLTRWAPLDRQLHRCVWDPAAEKVLEVLSQARQLLAEAVYHAAKPANRQPPRTASAPWR